MAPRTRSKKRGRKRKLEEDYEPPSEEEEEEEYVSGYTDDEEEYQKQVAEKDSDVEEFVTNKKEEDIEEEERPLFEKKKKKRKHQVEPDVEKANEDAEAFWFNKLQQASAPMKNVRIRVKQVSPANMMLNLEVKYDIAIPMLDIMKKDVVIEFNKD